MVESSFTLTKWYLDCVTAEGNAVILYSAKLGWRGITLSYNNVLSVNETCVRSQTSMARERVEGDSERIEVRLRAFDVEGHWIGHCAPYRTTVYASEEGAVDWNCLQPASNVRLKIGGQSIEGMGYAECLKVTLPPWRLPMRQLRWGRFVSQEHAFAWMDWQGSFNSSFAVLDGRRCALLASSEEAIACDGVRLQMHQSLPLRTGTLGATVLPSAPRLRRLLPRSLASIEEHKWRSVGTLTCGDQKSNGWVIHEVVQWNV